MIVFITYVMIFIVTNVMIVFITYVMIFIGTNVMIVIFTNGMIFIISNVKILISTSQRSERSSYQQAYMDRLDDIQTVLK